MVAGEEKRLEMMQNLFGDNSEEEEEEEIDSEHESNPHPNYPSDEAEGGAEPREEEAVVEVQVEAESVGEQGDAELSHGESEGEREQSSHEGDVADQHEESEEEEEGDEERVAVNRRRDVVESGSERSGERRYESEDEEVEQTRIQRSPSEEQEEAPVAQSDDVNIRNVFGSSDDEEDAEEYVRNDIEPDEPRSPVEDEEGSEKDQRPDEMGLDDMIPEEEPRYESEDEHVEARHRDRDRDRPVGPPMEVGVPFRPPPGDPEKMNMIKVYNIMGIDPKPFDAKTFVEEDTFERDEPGGKMRIRLANNIVRHRFVKGRDGRTYSESNARFVRWSDGSLQLLIGNEVLDITEQDARQDQNHLLVKHEKGILQSQGKIMKKMRFIPSSLTSNSHRLLTALVDSRQKKDFKVKNCVTHIDPEREKEKRERMESQNLKASTKLSQAREKVKRKYPLPVARRQLSTGYLEDALEEDEETDHYGSHRSNRGYEEDLEAEAQRERRIMNAKKSNKGFPGRSSMTSARPTRRQEYSESEREESEYETEEEEEEEEEERPRSRKRVKEPEDEYEEEEEVEEDEEEEEEAEGVRGDKDRGGSSSRKRKGIESDEEESPPRKAPTHRRKQEVLGQGTYGVVFKATDTKTGETVAIKKIRIGKHKEGVNITALREIKMLKELKHPHIILLIDAFPHKQNLHLVFEFMETDLEGVIRDSNVFLSPADVKSYLLMTLKGLAYCHEKRVLHRDMKPNNLLIGPDGQLKLADFGLARIFGSPDRKFTHQVFARWYRAPELLFGAKQYGAAVDVWAAGCIFAELLLRRPFLQGNSDIDQLSKIFAAFGTPKADQWPDMKNLPDYVEYQFVPAPSLRSLFPTVSEDALDLLSKMFTYDPKARISIKQALEHRYFTFAPSPTDPAKLPKPVRKQETKASYGKHEAIKGVSPPRKIRRVMPEHGRPDGMKSHVDKDQHAPMSLDFTVLAERPPNRPTITSADRSHLKRKLDLDFQ